MSSPTEGHKKYRLADVTADSPPPDLAAPTVIRWPRIRWCITWATIAYSVVLVLLLLVVCFSPGWFWPGVLMLYGPRWVLVLPWLGLLLPVLCFRRRMLILLAVDLGLFVPILGVCFPWRRALDPAVSGKRIRIVSCNVASGPKDQLRLRRWVDEVRADIVVLQDAGNDMSTHFRPDQGWTFRREGEIAIATKLPIHSVEAIGPQLGTPKKSSAVRYVVETKAGPLRMISVHLMTIRNGLIPLVHGHLGGFASFAEYSAHHQRDSDAIAKWALEGSGPLIVAGDFNMTVDHPAYRTGWSTYNNAFSQAGLGLGTTFATRLIRLRIDHVLGRGGLRPTYAEVGPEVGSDHHPILAEFVLDNK